MTLPQYVGADSINITSGEGETTGVTLQVSLNGAAFAAPANTPAHTADGFWRVELNATERDNAQVDVKVTKAGAVPQTRSFVNYAKQGTIEANVETWRGAVPDTLSSGKVQSDPGTVSANVAFWQGIPQVAVNGKPNVHVSEYAAGESPTDAIVAAHLDHLLQVATTSFPGNAGSILGEMLERITTWRYVTEALSQAPSGGGGLTQQDVADALKLAPTAGAPAVGSVNHALPLGEAPTAGGPLLTGGTGANQINTTLGAADANTVAWQDESLVAGTKMIENAPTVPRWTQAALNETWSVSLTEPTGRPSWGAMTYGALMSWLGVLSLNKRATTSSDARVRNNADNANIATAAQSDDNMTYLLGPWV